MYLILSLTLLVSYVSALASQPLDLQPLITTAPQIDIRDTPQSICGYYSTNGLGIMNALIFPAMRKAEK